MTRSTLLSSSELHGLYDRDLIVFDIDRTIINSTSWFRACMSPDLLIEKKKIDTFKHINSVEFNHRLTPSTSHTFRQETLALLQQHISVEFLSHLNESYEWLTFFSLDKYSDKLRLYVAGILTGQALYLYPEVVKIITFFRRRFPLSASFVFLSAGYHPFMKGVLAGLMKTNPAFFLRSYTLLGSEISAKNGRFYEADFLSQQKKCQVITDLIKSGNRLRFFADDNDEFEGLFSEAKKANATVIRVTHATEQHSSESLAKFLEGQDERFLATSLEMSTESSYGKVVYLEKRPPFISALSAQKNSIGIPWLDKQTVECTIERLLESLSSESERNEARRLLLATLLPRKDKVFLRGKLYYFWLTPSISGEPICLGERWLIAINDSLKLLSILVKSRALTTISTTELTDSDSSLVALLFLAVDHVTNCLLLLLFSLERASLAMDVDVLTVGMKN
jgi:hypothetical protein